jgi:hypothetical protein
MEDNHELSTFITAGNALSRVQEDLGLSRSEAIELIWDAARGGQLLARGVNELDLPMKLYSEQQVPEDIHAARWMRASDDEFRRWAWASGAFMLAGIDYSAVEFDQIALEVLIRSTPSERAEQKRGATDKKAAGGAPRKTELWDAVAIALARLAMDGALDRASGECVQTQAQLRRRILDDPDVAELGARDETLKPFVRKVWYAIIEPPGTV